MLLGLWLVSCSDVSDVFGLVGLDRLVYVLCGGGVCVVLFIGYIVICRGVFWVCICSVVFWLLICSIMCFGWNWLY